MSDNPENGNGNGDSIDANDNMDISSNADDLPNTSSVIVKHGNDNSLSVHVSPFPVDTKWMTIADMIKEKTSLEHGKDFSIVKLLPKSKAFRRRLSYVSFKIKVPNKDVFNTLMHSDMWGPDTKASKYDRSALRTKRLQRKSQVPKKAPNQHSHGPFYHQRVNFANADFLQFNRGHPSNQALLTNLLLQLTNVLLQSMT